MSKTVRKPKIDKTKDQVAFLRAELRKASRDAFDSERKFSEALRAQALLSDRCADLERRLAIAQNAALLSGRVGSLKAACEEMLQVFGTDITGAVQAIKWLQENVDKSGGNSDDEDDYYHEDDGRRMMAGPEVCRTVVRSLMEKCVVFLQHGSEMYWSR